MVAVSKFRPSWAALSQQHPASYSQFDTFTAAVCQRRAAIWGWVWGSWASLWHVFTSCATSLLQVDVFHTGFHANTTSSSVSAGTSQSWTVLITVEQAKPKLISWHYLTFCLCFLSHGSQNKSAYQSLSDDSKYDWITDFFILWCLIFPHFELFLFYP